MKESLKIYHNAECSKSNGALALLQEKGIEFEQVDYLNKSFTAQEVKDLLALLKLPAAELIRMDEPEFKHFFEDRDQSEEEYIAAMVRFPKLIQRPIVITGKRAVIGRPVERILELL